MSANPFDRIARLYDWEHDPYVADIDVHVAFARRFGSPVLELACGTGRLLAPLAASGARCTGIDSSAPMLERARARLAAAGLEAVLLRAPMQDYALDERFRTIIIGLDSFGLLIRRADQVRTLKTARRHVAHDGRLIIDVSNGNLRGANEPHEELLHDITAPSQDTGRLTTKFALRRPNHAEQIDDLMFFYDEPDERGYLRRTTVQLRLRWFTRFELELLLEQTGWEVSELYGNYDLEPFGVGSERLIVVARPRPA